MEDSNLGLTGVVPNTFNPCYKHLTSRPTGPPHTIVPLHGDIQLLSAKHESQP